jgi:hypothetical protein
VTRCPYPDCSKTFGLTPGPGRDRDHPQNSLVGDHSATPNAQGSASHRPCGQGVELESNMHHRRRAPLPLPLGSVVPFPPTARPTRVRQDIPGAVHTGKGRTAPLHLPPTALLPLPSMTQRRNPASQAGVLTARFPNAEYARQDVAFSHLFTPPPILPHDSFRRHPRDPALHPTQARSGALRPLQLQSSFSERQPTPPSTIDSMRRYIMDFWK